MNNYRLDQDRTLCDYHGIAIGKVDYWNRVRNSYRDKGQISANDRYVDEYGHDQGWTVPDYGGGDGGLGLALLLVMGLVALMVWLISALIEAVGAPKGRTTSARMPVAPSRPKPFIPKSNFRPPPLVSSTAQHPRSINRSNAPSSRSMCRGLRRLLNHVYVETGAS